MTILRKAVALAAMTGAGVLATSGIASAAMDDGNTWSDSVHHDTGDDGTSMGGVIPVDGLQNVGVDANAGCLANHTVPDLTAQSLIGLVPIAANLSHLAQNVDLSALNNGSNTTNAQDNGCVSNQGSDQTGNNSHHSNGAGNSTSDNDLADGDGAHNDKAGDGAGGLLGATGLLGAGGQDDNGHH